GDGGGLAGQAEAAEDLVAEGEEDHQQRQRQQQLAQGHAHAPLGGDVLQRGEVDGDVAEGIGDQKDQDGDAEDVHAMLLESRHSLSAGGAPTKCGGFRGRHGDKRRCAPVRGGYRQRYPRGGPPCAACCSGSSRICASTTTRPYRPPWPPTACCRCTCSTPPCCSRARSAAAASACTARAS